MAPVKQLFIFCLLATAAPTSTTVTSTTDLGTSMYTTTPDTSDLTMGTSIPTPDTSDLTMSTSTPTPDTSDLTMSTSTPTPDTSDLTMGTSTPTPDTSDLTTGTSTPTPDTSDRTTVMSTMTLDTSDLTTVSTPGMTEIPPTPGPCGSNPCPRDSRCEEVYQGFRCLCRPGLFYNVDVNSCILGKIFPNELTVNTTFEPEMGNNKSEEFKKTADDIVAVLNKTFKDQPGYMGSIVYSLREGSVIADVESFFLASSEVTDELVHNLLFTATESDGLLIEFTPRNISCKEYCVESTTDCKTVHGLATCTCKDGYVISTATEQSCVACPSGEKAVNSDTCKACDFGYSGFNCDEYYLLAVVIISCVLGALLIAALVAVIVLSCRGSKKSTQFSNDSGAFGDMNFHKPAGIPRIPRANHNSDWEPANLEATDSGSTRALVTKDQPENIAMEKYYDPYNYDTRGNRSQTPSRNGYGNGNGYGSRGTRNPYYDPDEDRI